MPPAKPTRAQQPGRTWRDAVATASGLNFLAGIWLMTAPFVLAYDDGDPVWIDIAFGAVIAILAFARATRGTALSWLSYANVVAGTWVFSAAFWAYDSPRAAWNDLLVGALVAIFAVLSVTASDAPDATERAWYRR